MAIDISKVPTPCYVMDEDLLRKNLEIIRNVADRTGTEIVLAFKAFSLWPAFPIVREYFTGATASSIHEARLAYEEMGAPAHTYSPAYTEKDFPAIMACSSHITFNSLSQFERFKPHLKKYNKHISSGLRINPEYSEVSTDLYNPCSPGSRLGIPTANMPENLPEDIEGLHFHALCESSSHELEQVLEQVEKNFSNQLQQIQWLNLGGGHLMTRKGYDIEHLVNILNRFKNKWGLHLILEPGSAFAWETGVLVSEVVDVIENHGIQTAILNVSFTAHMPDCLEMPYKPIISGARHKPVQELPTYRMGGNSCLAGDFMGYWSFDEPLKPGDRIVFEDMIHYTLVKTTMFNGIPHPSIAFWNEDRGLKMIREFGYDDYKTRMG